MEASVGYHGKMPCRGDFVQKGLPSRYIERWDNWLQESVFRSKEVLGERWLDVYLTSPIWRFVLSPGVIDEEAWCGAIMPSVDRVNRYFPLTIAANLTQGSSVFCIADACEGWFATAESLLFRALEDDHLDLDEFAQSVCDHVLPECANDQSLAGVDAEINASGEFSFSLQGTDKLTAHCPGLLEIFTRKKFEAFSLWWTCGSENVAPRARLYDQLPDPVQYVELLTDQ